MSAQSDQNKQSTLKFFNEVLNQQNLDLIPTLLAPNYLFNGDAQSAADNATWVKGLHAAYPNLAFTVEAILAEDDMVALRWRLDAPAFNGRPAGFTKGTNIVVFANGLAVSNDENAGRASALTGY